MEREYELFEQLPDGTPVWRSHASGLHMVRSELQKLAKTTTNMCFAIYLPTKEIVARLNVGHSAFGQKPVVFQIAYDSSLVTTRSAALKLHGYEVVSVIGNEAAKVILELQLQQIHLFVIGHAAPEEDRMEMVAWLRAKYPGVRILALNPPRIPELPGADYNVKLDDPEKWLPMVANALSEHRSGDFSSS